MNARAGFLTTDAVGIISGQGDRIDRLERTLPAVAGVDQTASYVPLRTVPGTGVPTRVGKVTLPDGISRLDALGLFASTGGTFGTLGIGFGSSWEEEHFLLAGLTTIDGGAGTNARLVGLALCRSAGRTTAPFYIIADTSDDSPVQVTAVLFISPVGSVSFD